MQLMKPRGQTNIWRQIAFCAAVEEQSKFTSRQWGTVPDSSVLMQWRSVSYYSITHDCELNLLTGRKLKETTEKKNPCLTIKVNSNRFRVFLFPERKKRGERIRIPASGFLLSSNWVPSTCYSHQNPVNSFRWPQHKKYAEFNRAARINQQS